FGGAEPPKHDIDEGSLEPIPHEDAERIESFCATLDALRAEAPVRPLDELVERTMAAFAYDLSLLARPGGRGRMANVRKLMRLALPAAASRGLWDLDALLREERDAEAEEGCRLVYVATTRAKDRLILSGVCRPSTGAEPADPKPGDTPLERLLPALRDLGWDG